MVAAFAPDAYVNDARREISGIDAIRRWAEKEMVGDHVTMEPLEVVDHYGETIVRSRYDGTYDKTSLPAVRPRTDQHRRKPACPSNSTSTPADELAAVADDRSMNSTPCQTIGLVKGKLPS
jgi:hypothetical protein